MQTHHDFCYQRGVTGVEHTDWRQDPIKSEAGALPACAQAPYGIYMCIEVELTKRYCHGCAVHAVHRGSAAVADARATGAFGRSGVPPPAPAAPGHPQGAVGRKRQRRPPSRLHCSPGCV